MNIVFLQAASGELVNGPTVRVPSGNYTIEFSGSYHNCKMYINECPPIELNGRVILSNPSSIRMVAEKAENLTVRFVKE